MGQSASAPLQTTAPPQAGLPRSPLGAALQLPSLPARLQRSQLPLQAWLQQKPSAQNPEVHCALLPQAVPVARSGSQLPALQKRPVAHWRLVVQVDGHPPVTPSHA
jgi:hypothetical protein